MNNEVFLTILSAILTIFVAVFTTIILPSIRTLLKSRFTESQLATAMEWANAAVRCAEQTIPEEEWKKKKQEVLLSVSDFVNNNLNLTLTPDMLEVLIESSVYDKNVEKKDKHMEKTFL